MRRAVGRKTVDIAGVVRHANYYLALPSTNKDERIGVIFLLEACLNRVGQYKGFQYLSDKEVDDVPGIWSDRDEQTRFDGTDHTRRKYIYQERTLPRKPRKKDSND